ncbi:MAG: TonB-dependent receptor plug domain-containing protein [Bdellovibrionales bacterium]|nr:TonB-dependent receptor plug domain-containing protein [Bdellovibrionales bacterium]
MKMSPATRSKMAVLNLSLSLLLSPLRPTYASTVETAVETPESGPVSDLSLEDLMALPVTIASSRSSSIREAPGIISLMTRDEIRASGARDLGELLERIPGLSLASDVAQTTGLGVRGVWAHEGKVLFRIDGFEWNEAAFNVFLIGDRIPLSSIEQIQIIRGPGSVIFGGLAEVAVVDIKTTSANSPLSPTFTSETRVGLDTAGHLGRAGATVTLNTDTYGALITGTMHRTADGTYNSLAGDSASDRAELAGQSLLAPKTAIFQTTISNWNFRALYDDVDLVHRASYGTPEPQGVLIRFLMGQASISRDFAANNWIISPHYNYAYQAPWLAKDPTLASSGNFCDKAYTQHLTRLMAKTTIENGFLAFGVEHRVETGHSRSDGTAPNGKFFPALNPSERFEQNATSFFGELSQSLSVGELTAGLRHQSSSRVPSSTVPRISLTKILEPWHFKALTSLAYRAPSIENISLNPSIRPEETETYEIEVGRALSPSTHLTLNVYFTKIENPIIYTTIIDGLGNNVDSYQNFTRTGSKASKLNFGIINRD